MVSEERTKLHRANGAASETEPCRSSVQENAILRLLLDHLSATVWSTDADLRITGCYGSQQLSQNLLPDGRAGRSLGERFDDSAASLLEAHRRALTGAASTCEMEWCGRTFQCHVDGIPGVDGSSIGCLCLALDVTDQARAVKERADEHKLLRTLVDTLPDFIVIKDSRCRYVLNNLAHLHLLGVQSAEEATGRSDFDFFPQQMAAAFYTDEQDLLSAGKTLNREEPIVDAEGVWRWVSTVRVPLRDSSGAIVGLVGTSRDITDMKMAEAERSQLLVREKSARQEAERAEAEVRRLNAELEQRVQDRTAQLEAANKELEAFAYTVSHDLRAPLRAIDGFSRILIEDHGPQLRPEAEHYLQRVRENAARMGQLVDDLLGFSRLSRHPLTRRAIRPADIARQVVDELKGELEGRSIKITVANLPASRGDAALVRQVLANLISNAVKFTRMAEAATVEVGYQQSEDGLVTYFVRDNGIGFDMRYAHKLFGVFQRLHRPDDFEGTGVGLAIVHRIVVRHGGRVWAEASPGCGATFYFTLHSPSGSPEEQNQASQ